MKSRSFGKGLTHFATATAATLAVAIALIFFWAPIDADQGFIQKIFYVHVPMAIVALIGFMVAGGFAIAHLRTRDPSFDYRSYVAIHMSVIFGVAVLLTGAIWARASWGKWWVWDEPTLVSFLIVFLLYVVYYPLRYSIDDPDRQGRYASVFAITAGAFVPINFIAVRLSESLVHPRVLNETAGDMPIEMRITFFVALAAIALLYTTLVKLELTAKSARMQLRSLRRALEDEQPAAPSLGSPLSTVPARPE